MVTTLRKYSNPLVFSAPGRSPYHGQMDKAKWGKAKCTPSLYELEAVSMTLTGVSLTDSIFFVFRDVMHKDNFGDDQWYTCDDERISKMNGPLDLDSSTAYVLFYTKSNQIESRQSSRRQANL